MLERFKRSSSTNDAPRDRGAVATAERPADEPAEDRGIRRDSESTRDETAVADDRTTTRDDRTAVHDDRTAVHDDRTLDDERAARRDDRSARRASRTGNGVATASALETARARQRDEYGGINWGASFFGWLVAIGVAALLTALLAAAGAAIGLTVTEDQATSNTEELGLGGGIALLVVLMLAYYAGGYVAGRMSRFDGGRQGLGTWAIGLLVTIVLAIAAVVFGDEYNVLERLDLPSLPVGDETLATGGIIALVAIVLGTLVAAMFGGKVGERYHKRIDRAGFVD
jgi:hypothetical protein